MKQTDGKQDELHETTKDTLRRHWASQCSHKIRSPGGAKNDQNALRSGIEGARAGNSSRVGRGGMPPLSQANHKLSRGGYQESSV